MLHGMMLPLRYGAHFILHRMVIVASVHLYVHLSVHCISRIFLYSSGTGTIEGGFFIIPGPAIVPVFLAAPYRNCSGTTTVFKEKSW